jgi:hypothetical protein
MRRSLLLSAFQVLAALIAASACSGPVESHNRRADSTPLMRFHPLLASSPCPGATTDPFLLPSGYRQEVLVQERDGGSKDLFDMQTQNETGQDKGRFLYRTHEVDSGSQVTVTDLSTGVTEILAERADWEQFDGIVWTPWGTILASEEVLAQSVPDRQFPGAVAGLVYEFFVDPNDPSELRLDNPLDDVAPFNDGIAARPELGSKSHEGMRFDKRGYHYGISESNPGGIFRFIPDTRGDLSEGTLYVLDTPNGHDGDGRWRSLSDDAAETDAQAAANALGANGYNQPEDVETGTSSGRDENNGGHTLYVAVTGSNNSPDQEVLAVDLRDKDGPFAYHYVFVAAHPSLTGAGLPNAPIAEFQRPDNLALDREGNLAITEDPGGDPRSMTGGDGIWIAAPPEAGEGQHEALSTVQRFATLRDCIAEPTGVYFAMLGTEEILEDAPWADDVTDESLFVNRQHSGQGTTLDQFVSITPENND